MLTAKSRYGGFTADQKGKKQVYQTDVYCNVLEWMFASYGCPVGHAWQKMSVNQDSILVRTLGLMQSPN